MRSTRSGDRFRGTGSNRGISSEPSDECSVWNISNREIEMTYKRHHEITCVVFSPDGNMMAVGCADKHVSLCDLASREIKYTLAEKEQDRDDDLTRDSSVRALVFSPGGSRIAFARSDDFVYIWGITAEKLEHKLPDHWRLIYTVTFGADDSFRSTAPYFIDPSHRWVLYKGERVFFIPQESTPQSVAAKGSDLILGGKDGKVTFLSFNGPS